jgi:hypothetical protein
MVHGKETFTLTARDFGDVNVLSFRELTVEIVVTFPNTRGDPAARSRRAG